MNNDMSRYKLLKTAHGNVLKVDTWEMICKKRQIEHLCHITRAIYLPSIFEHGIMSAVDLEWKTTGMLTLSRNHAPNNKIYCSITFPNYYYYRSLKHKHPFIDDYVVVYVNIKYLLNQREDDVLFYQDAPTNKGITPVSFDKLFLSKVAIMNGTVFKRERENLQDNLTTLPQATIVFSKSISAIYIDNIYCPNTKVYDTTVKALQKLGKQNIAVCSSQTFNIDKRWPSYQAYRQACYAAQFFDS